MARANRLKNLEYQLQNRRACRCHGSFRKVSETGRKGLTAGRGAARMGHSGNASQGARKLIRAGAQKLRQMKSVLEEISENEQCKIRDSED